MSSPSQLRARRKKPSDESSAQALELAEKVSGQALHDARTSYDALYERVYKFATLLAGGAGGAAILALGKIGAPSAEPQLAGLSVLSLWWFVIVAGLLLLGGASRPMKAGTNSASVRERFLAQTAKGDSDSTALWNTRWGHLSAVDQQISDYAKGASVRSRVVDQAYWCACAGPVLAGLAAYYFS